MSVFSRIRLWFKGLDLLGGSKDAEKGSAAAPAPGASAEAKRSPDQRVPSNAVAVAPAPVPSRGHTQAPAVAQAPATFPAASQQQQQQPSQGKQAPASGPAQPARAKLTPEQQREEFFTEYGEANRYSILEVVGKGSYGIVCSAIDNFTGEKVAIKKITNVFEHVSDATRILREIKLLRMLKHPDIVKIQHIMLPPNPRDYQDIYVVFELMETDLHQVIKANDDLTPEHHQFFLYQMLRGLKYLHSAKVFHRDLKPKNILANADCKLKICDFGLARPAFDNMPTMVFWTDYVATRWYRAPELCGSFFAKYSPAIDIWGVGCIFAEVLLGRPLFPGKNVVNQLELITDLLGTPSPDVVAKVRNEKARRFLQSMPTKQGVSLSQVFPGVDRKALHLLRAMLSFDPAERPTAEQALQHPYFAGLHNPAREPTTMPVSKLAFEFDRRKLSVEEVRELIYQEVLEYHPAAMAAYRSGSHHRANYGHPNALENFKRVFMHLESNPGTVLAPGYQGRARQTTGASVAGSGSSGAAAAAPAPNRQSSQGLFPAEGGRAPGAGWGEKRSSRPEGKATGPCGGAACSAAPAAVSDRASGNGLLTSAGAAAAAAMIGGPWPPTEPRQRTSDCRSRAAALAQLMSANYSTPAPGQLPQDARAARQAASAHGGAMTGNAARGAAAAPAAPQLPGGREAGGMQHGTNCTGCAPRSSNSSSCASSTTTNSGMITAATTATTLGSAASMALQGGAGGDRSSTPAPSGPLPHLSPGDNYHTKRNTNSGVTTGSRATANGHGSELLSPVGRHSLQLHRTQDMDDMDRNIASRVSMPAPADGRAAAPVEPSQQAAAVHAAMQPNADAWSLNRHSMPGPAYPVDSRTDVMTSQGAGAGMGRSALQQDGKLPHASAHANSDVAAALAMASAQAAAKERASGGPVVPALGLPGNIHGDSHAGLSAFGLVGLPTDGVVLSDREREEVYRDEADEARLMDMPVQRLYRAASIS